MLGGLIPSAEIVEIGVIVDASGSATTGADYSYSASAVAAYCPDAVDVAPTISIEVSGSKTSTGCTVSAPGCTYSGTGATDARVRLLDYQVFETGALRVVCGGVQILVGGSVVATGGAFTVTNPRNAPDAVAPFGYPLKLTLQVDADGGVTTPPCGPTSVSASISATQSGGIRFYKDGAWSDFAVEPDPMYPASTTDANGDYPSAPFGLTLTPFLSERSWGDHIEGTASASMSLTGTGPTFGVSKSREISGGGSIWLFNADAQKVTRFDSDYEALVIRFQFPQYSGESVRNWFIAGAGTWSGPPAPLPSGNASLTTLLQSGLSQQVRRVTNTPGDIEYPLNRTIYSPVRTGASKGIGSGTETYGECEPVPSPLTQSESLSYQSETLVATLAAAMGHDDPVARRFNTWGNPLWSFGMWFPYDALSSSVRWDLLGADSDIEYWYNIRQQHVAYPLLSSEDATGRRVNVTTEPIKQNGIIGVAQALTAMPCFWGITGFRIETEVFPTEFTTNSTSVARFAFWSGATPGTGSVGSTITINSGSDAVEFELASFTDYPYMTTTLADRLKVVWTDSNISAVKVFAIGADGTSVQIGPTGGVVSDTVYRIPYGDSAKWATSAAGDFGAGYLTDDYTPDAGVSADDISAATLSDAERISSFGLLPGFSPVKIRIEITRAGSYTGNVTIQHPTFYMAPWADAKVFHESGLVSTILFKNGPMVGYGRLGFFDYLLDTPLSVPVPFSGVVNKTTIGDLWCWENVFLRGESALTGLLTRMEAEFIESEEFPPGVIKHLWRYSDGESYFLDSLSGVVNSSVGPRLWYLNTWRCLPPLAYFASKERGTDDGWLDNGDVLPVAYSDVCNKHPHIVPGNIQPHLMHGGTDHLAFAAAPEGWSVGTFSGAVDNNESQDWVLRWNETDWFGMRPWRGQVGMFGIAGLEESVMSFDVDHNSHLHVLATITDAGKVKIGIAGNPLLWDYTTTDIDASWVCCRIDRDSTEQAILLVTADAGSVKLYKSVDRGETFTLARTVSSGGSPEKPVVLVGRNGVRQMYWIDGTEVKGQIADRADNIIESTFTATTGVDNKGVAVDEDVTETGKKRTLLYCVKGGVLTELKSDDGKTFS